MELTEVTFETIDADKLIRGMTFDLFGTECFIVYAEPNKFGMMVIRFVTDTDKDAMISHMVVPLDFKFPIPYGR